MAGVATAVTLTDEERAQLTAWIRQGTAERRGRRPVILRRDQACIGVQAGRPGHRGSKWRTRFCPATVGQAGRLHGVNPGAVSVLLVHLEKLKRSGVY